jgi:hypothetical protein
MIFLGNHLVHVHVEVRPARRSRYSSLRETRLIEFKFGERVRARRGPGDSTVADVT